MKISEILSKKSATLSFEVFPPKKEAGKAAVERAVCEIAALKPDFMSVTYGAGGTTDDYTVEMAQKILAVGVTPVAHFSCITATKASVAQKLKKLKELGIENVLALRGDLPEDFEGEMEYKYASDLVKDVKAFGGFCIGGACYPEGHPQSPTLFADIENLKKKADAGCDFLTTQMFFDNDVYFSFLSKVREAGITVPVIAGIMPVTNAKQIKRILSLSGGALPAKFKRIIDRFGENEQSMRQAGIVYASEQIIDLYANGVKGVHVYSMNKPEVAAAIRSNLSEII